MNTKRSIVGLAMAVLMFPLSPSVPTASELPALRIGLDADMSSAAAEAGEAIRRGIVLAAEELNAAGGVLGHRLELVVRDHRGNPARGLDNLEEFAAMSNLVAIVGGVHTPVALHQIEAIHRHGVLYLGSWAAGTPVVENGHDPNYVFRVSVRDELAGGFLVDKAVAEGHARVALLLERTGWGRSNQRAMTRALEDRGLAPVATRWFNLGAPDLAQALIEAASAGADVVLLVAGTREGAVAVRDMAALPEHMRLPIISHWGITSGDLPARAGHALEQVDLSFLQTFSFLEPPHPDRAERVFERYRARFPGVESVADVIAPVGTAHAYDIVHLLARAIESAGSVQPAAVREGLLSIERHEGLVRDYAPPFRPGWQDALDVSDFRLARFGPNGSIVPIAR